MRNQSPVKQLITFTNKNITRSACEVNPNRGYSANGISVTSFISICEMKTCQVCCHIPRHLQKSANIAEIYYSKLYVVGKMLHTKCHEIFMLISFEILQKKIFSYKVYLSFVNNYHIQVKCRFYIL